MEKNRVYACIDLKSFYASVECQERGLDPLTTNLVVADRDRTAKTICLAVSPALKQYGIPGRARLFEVDQKVRNINFERRKKAYRYTFTGKSVNDMELKKNPNLELEFIAAKPRMAYYMKYSAQIYNIYLKYIAPEDIYVYSIDEVFCDLTDYLDTYKLTPQELVTKMIKDVVDTTGITATAGIGTNMYLCKIAMDIVAKHAKPNEFGVRIASLDEMSYRKLLWEHRPLTDFWRVGIGYTKKLEAHRMYTMGDIARCSIENEELLYILFGVNAELLIDHAWGYEPATMQSVKSYTPETTSISSGQVLHCAYDFKKARLIVQEMVDSMCLELVEKGMVTNQMTLTIGYDVENLTNTCISRGYHGEIVEDRYGRKIPKHAHGTVNIDHYTSSAKIIQEEVLKLYDKIVDEKLLIRRMYINANKLQDESIQEHRVATKQLDFFSDYTKQSEEVDKKYDEEKNEKKVQKAMVEIKKKFGKNAVLKGMNLYEGATMKERNRQIGGHHE